MLTIISNNTNTTPNPPTNCGFQRVGLEHNLNLKGWNFQAHREFPGKFESSNVSRDNVSRGIGRTTENIRVAGARPGRRPAAPPRRYTILDNSMS